MFVSKGICVLFLFASFLQTYTEGQLLVWLCPQSIGYYWRDYNGTIPQDALIGGKDINGTNIYIGQAYVHNVGIIVAEIHPGKKDVYFHLAHQPYTISSYIKILCGRQEYFYWGATNATNMHAYVRGKQPVVGGHVTQGILNIGRAKLDGDTKIGRIHSYLDQPDLDVSNKGQEVQIVNSYEILIYRGP